MSTTIDKIDAVQSLNKWLQALIGMYSADINAVPDDKWTATFGGCTRSAAAVTADNIGLLVWMAEVLKGNMPSGDQAEAMKSLEAACATKQGALEAFQTASANFSSALTSATDETLNKLVMAPWQMELPVFMLCHVAVSHIWYHDGQLNYIHTLLGDSTIHWMGN